MLCYVLCAVVLRFALSKIMHIYSLLQSFYQWDFFFFLSVLIPFFRFLLWSKRNCFRLQNACQHPTSTIMHFNQFFFFLFFIFFFHLLDHKINDFLCKNWYSLHQIAPSGGIHHQMALNFMVMIYLPFQVFELRELWIFV